MCTCNCLGLCSNHIHSGSWFSLLKSLTNTSYHLQTLSKSICNLVPDKLKWKLTKKIVKCLKSSFTKIRWPLVKVQLRINYWAANRNLLKVHYNLWQLTSLDSPKISLLSEWPRMTQGISKLTSISALRVHMKSNQNYIIIKTRCKWHYIN